MSLRGVAIFVFGCHSALASSLVFHEITSPVPLAANESFTAYALNNSGDVTGWDDAQGQLQSYVLSPSGTFSFIKAPPKCFSTYSFGIDAQSTVLGSTNCEVGTVDNPQQAFKSFLLGSDGLFKDFPVEPVPVNWRNISESDNLIGSISSSISLLALKDGSVQIFDLPGADTAYSLGVNDRGDVVGQFTRNGSSVPHGFIRNSNGVLTYFDIPNTVGTTPYGINDQGDIVGVVQTPGDPSTIAHGFFRATDGSVQIVDNPNAGIFTGFFGINDLREVAGFYTTKDQIYRPFTVSFPAAQVPEPTTAQLFALPLLAAVFLSRRFSQQRHFSQARL